MAIVFSEPLQCNIVIIYVFQPPGYIKNHRRRRVGDSYIGNYTGNCHCRVYLTFGKITP